MTSSRARDRSEVVGSIPTPSRNTRRARIFPPLIRTPALWGCSGDRRSAPEQAKGDLQPEPLERREDRRAGSAPRREVALGSGMADPACPSTRERIHGPYRGDEG